MGRRRTRPSFTSAVWSNVPVVARWSALAVPADGAEDTVNAGAMDVRDEAAPFATATARPCA